MKRPTIALLSVLMLLALGLAASGPRPSHAGSLGELAFAMQIESTDMGDPIVCPKVCCPYFEEETARDEPEIALNAAETNESTTEERIEGDYDYYADEYYYEDEYYEEYGSEYSEADATDMELNAAETTEDEQLADDGTWDEYYGDYAYDYNDFEDEYSHNESEELTDCNDTSCEPVHVTPTASSQISDDDLVLDNHTYECPYDCYGHQVGDDNVGHDNAADATTEKTYDEYDDSYYEDYYYEDYYGQDFDTQDSTDETASDETVAETYEEDYERYYTEEYYNQLPEPKTQATETATETYADEYEEYYEDYYGEEYEEYYYDEATNSVEKAEDESTDWIDDYTSEYDAIYDNAVYGQPLESAGTDAPSPPVVADACVEEAYMHGECIDETNAQIVDDLPWADEVCGECVADVAQIDIPTTGEASEYGSDYAEEYYDAYFDWLEQQDVAPAADDADELSDEYYDLYFDWIVEQDDTVAQAEACAAPASPAATAKTVHKTFDITAYATYLGDRFAKLTDSITNIGNSIRTAAVDLNTRSR